MNTYPVIGPELSELMRSTDAADIWSLARTCKLPVLSVLGCISNPSFAIFATLPDDEARTWIELRGYLQSTAHQIG